MPVRVLIVDDEDRFRVAARAVVEAAEGFEVAGSAGTGGEAVAKARELAPDLVLMDASLPGIDGVEAARRILREGRGIAVVLLLSTAEAATVGASIDVSVTAAWVPKSAFGPDRLEQVWAAISGP